MNTQYISLFAYFESSVWAERLLDEKTFRSPMKLIGKVLIRYRITSHLFHFTKTMLHILLYLLPLKSNHN